MKESYYQRNKERILKRVNAKYKEDKKFREKVKNYNKNRYHTDIEYKEKTIERAKSRYRKKNS